MTSDLPPSTSPAPAPTLQPPELSVVVPVYNEVDTIAPLIDEICAALTGRLVYEIVYVDDGSTDGTNEALARAQEAGAPLRVVRHRTRSGQSAALASGVESARGPWIATLDGDGQNDPADIPMLLTERDRHPPLPPIMVCGQRRKRRDGWIKRTSSRVANAVRGRLLRDRTPDTGCGLKLFPRAAFLALPTFDHMHRFLPALFQRQGGTTKSVDVHHRPRQGGRSKYGVWNRLWVGIVDLFGVYWLQRRVISPEVDARSEPSPPIDR